MKKFLAVLLTVCLLAGLMVPALAAEEKNIFVTFQILGDEAHGGDFDEAHTYAAGNLTEWLTTTLWMDKGSTVADLVGQQLTKWGYTQEGLENDYITSITTPTGVTLASGTNGDASGWQYAYNYRIGDKTMSQQVLEEDAVVTLCYTDDWAAEDYVNSLQDVYEGKTLTGDVAYERDNTWVHIYGDDGFSSIPYCPTMYALKDENGFETNYIRARDLAKQMQHGWELHGGKRFNVSWDEATGAICFDTNTDYVAQESEDELPFSGDRNYIFATSPVLVDGKEVEMEVLLLQDGLGRGYTYYKIRDLGAVLGFDVDWNGTININRPERETVDTGLEVPPENMNADNPVGAN